MQNCMEDVISFNRKGSIRKQSYWGQAERNGLGVAFPKRINFQESSRGGGHFQKEADDSCAQNVGVGDGVVVYH